MFQFDLDNNFRYHAPVDEYQVNCYADIRLLAKRFTEYLIQNVPNSRERSVAITHIETAMFWANAGMARHYQLPAASKPEGTDDDKKNEKEPEKK